MVFKTLKYIITIKLVIIPFQLYGKIWHRTNAYLVSCNTKLLSEKQVFNSCYLSNMYKYIHVCNLYKPKHQTFEHRTNIGSLSMLPLKCNILNFTISR